MPRFRSCLACLLACAGCAVSPEARFYTLNAPRGLQQQKTAIVPAQYSIAVGPVSVPEMVDRPQFVIRRGAHRVAIVEQHRWAQPLRLELAGALAADLGQMLPQARVALYNIHAVRDADCRVLMDIERFDAVLDEAVTVQSWWTVRCNASAAPRSGRSLAQEPARGGFEALAAAYGRALAAISVEIAQVVTALQTGK